MKFIVFFSNKNFLNSEKSRNNFSFNFYGPSSSLKSFIPFYVVIIISAHDMSQMVSFVGVSFVAFSCGGKQTGIVLYWFLSLGSVYHVSFGQDFSLFWAVAYSFVRYFMNFCKKIWNKGNYTPLEWPSVTVIWENGQLEQSFLCDVC